MGTGVFAASAVTVSCVGGAPGARGLGHQHPTWWENGVTYSSMSRGPLVAGLARGAADVSVEWSRSDSRSGGGEQSLPRLMEIFLLCRLGVELPPEGNGLVIFGN